MWELAHTTARLALPGRTAQLDLARPQDGLHFSTITVLRIESSLGFQPETVSEAYTRGSDLFVAYPPDPRHNIRPDVYWRALVGNGWSGVELILSVQTSLLDSDSSLTTHSSLLADEVLGLHGEPIDQIVPAPGVVLARRTGSSTYAEFMFPSDFSQATVRRVANSDANRDLVWQWFGGERLEKGVIRRARLRAVWLDRANDLELAAACYRDFVASPLPLTT